jgi:hypothetical protein
MRERVMSSTVRRIEFALNAGSASYVTNHPVRFCRLRGERLVVLPLEGVQVKTLLDGPAGVIDWPLLHRAATEVADELTLRRATAALQRGASEKSRTLRGRLREVAAVTPGVDGIGDLLDRLEEVRVEDYDHRPQMRSLQDQLQGARRPSISAGERHDLLTDAVRRGLELFGRPQEGAAPEADVVDAEDLRLVAWELLIAPESAPLPHQTRLPNS